MEAPCILGLATADAPFRARQSDIRRAALEIFDGAEFDAGELGSVFDNAGIERRTLAWPLERYLAGGSPRSRNERFLELAPELCVRAARSAATPELLGSVTHVVSVCTSGVAVPSLDARVMGALELDRSARRVPVFGLGCAGGAAGLALAADLACSSAEARVLLLTVELTSLTLLSTDRTPRNFVACALFGDGAAAVVVGRPDAAHPPLARLHGGRSVCYPDSEDLMGWQVEDDGWRLVMSPRIPAVVRREARGLVRAACGERRPRRWVLHPGGAKVMSAYAEALELGPAELESAAGVLREHGNMSAVTVLYVLERELARRRPGDEAAVLTAFGPGFHAEARSLSLLANA